MKRNLSLFILIFEVTAIIALHAAKLNQQESSSVTAKKKEVKITAKAYPSLINTSLINQLFLIGSTNSK